jgi:light-regulated signal transduction histidine kinase (bacteriophytochrome)
MRSVMENLLGNAWKFTSRKPDAEIEVGGSPERGEYFVRDNGAGFDMAYADRLFGTFQRLHDFEEFPGTGIGLATVARAISRQGGRIRAQAAPGQGATFYFTLPAA